MQTNRIARIATALTLFAGVALGQDSQRKDEAAGQKPAQDTEAKGDAADNQDAAWWKARSGSPEVYWAICDQPKHHGQADLCQQWRSAEAANNQVNIGIAQLVLSVCGFVGLLFTIRYTQRTFRLTAHTAEQELRPYVFMDTFSITDMASDGVQTIADRRGEVFVVIHIKNSGQTPANNLRHSAQLACCEFTEENNLSIRGPLLERYQSNIPPGGSLIKTLTLPQRLTHAEMDAVNNSQKGIYLSGRIEYSDAFSTKRFTNYRLVYIGVYPPPPHIALNFCHGGNDHDQSQPETGWIWRIAQFCARAAKAVCNAFDGKPPRQS